jgi:hypothetical protein
MCVYSAEVEIVRENNSTDWSQVQKKGVRVGAADGYDAPFNKQIIPFF